MSECGGVQGAYTTDVVNVGWYGYETTKNTAIRVGPGIEFDIKESVKQGKRVGVQSTRNPKGLDNPPKRPTHRDKMARRWAWVYVLDGGATGWIMTSTLREREDTDPWARGPGGHDFHVGLEKCRIGPKSSCHGKRRNRLRIIDAKDVYLRYGAKSTAFHYLQSGDEVRELFRRSLNDYAAVSVVRSNTAPENARGWVSVTALRAEKASGIDVSVFQGDPDYEKVKGSGEDFLIVKATEGEGFQDQNFLENVSRGRKASLKVGAYHFLRPRRGRKGSAEADDFIRALRKAKLGKGDIRPVVDVEVSELDRNDTETYVGQFVGEMRMAGYDPIIYTFPSFMVWTKNFNCPLWIAHYEVKKPKLPDPWNHYVLWQYTSEGKVPGVAGKVDRNKCPDLSRIIQR